jgi:hypothetical protein
MTLIKMGSGVTRLLGLIGGGKAQDRAQGKE